MYIGSMKLEFKSLIALIDHFKNEKICRDYLEKARWGNKVTCPKCDHDKTWRTDRGFKCASKACNKKFSVTVGTIFENTKLPLRTWFAAIYLCTSHKKGISSLQLSRDLDIGQKAAWFMLHRIREMMTERAPELLEGIVEADETFVGGKNKNKHKSKRFTRNQGRSLKDKTPVFGIVQRDGLVIAKPVKDTKGTTLKPLIKELVKEGSVLVTDEWSGYNNMSKAYAHQVLKHKMDEFVRGDYHTNTIEGFWSLVKRGISGVYHSVSAKHLQGYLNEYAWRYNHRDDGRAMFELALLRAARR